LKITPTVLQLGDSGAWVVNTQTKEVHGHIVASDIFGRGYVVPLCDTFEDVKQSLSAQSVLLPTAELDLQPQDHVFPASIWESLLIANALPQNHKRTGIPDSGYASLEPTPENSPQPRITQHEVDSEYKASGFPRNPTKTIRPAFRTSFQPSYNESDEDLDDYY
jgi:hypothetical protein